MDPVGSDAHIAPPNANYFQEVMTMSDMGFDNMPGSDLESIHHLLVSGPTGSGKSNYLHCIILSLLKKNTPDDLRMLLIDTRLLELSGYDGIPHLLVPVVTDVKKAIGTFGWMVTEMNNRYKVLATNGARSLDEYNDLAATSAEIVSMPRIAVIIDELADLFAAAPKETEDSISAIVINGSKVGIHLIAATQTTQIEKKLKNLFPSAARLSVKQLYEVELHVLYQNTVSMMPPLVKSEDILSARSLYPECRYDVNVAIEIEKRAMPETRRLNDNSDDLDGDTMLPEAIECVVEAGMASTSLLQRRLKLGYARAAMIIDEMERRGIVGPYEDSKPRQVLMTKQQLYEMKMAQEP